MGIGRIASFLSSLSPASESAANVAASDATDADSARLAEESGSTQDRRNGSQSQQSGDVTQQLQTMISAVRQLNDNAVQQGAAVAVSSAGAQLKNAVTGLGHLLATIDVETLRSAASTQVKQANEVIDAVEAGVAGSQAAAEQLVRQMPAQAAQQAQQASQRFQVEMRNALDQVRGSLSAAMR